MRAYDHYKRIIDVTFSVVALVLTAPVQLIIAGLVRKKLGSPVLFRQERPGRNEQRFELIKFRTMLEPDIGAGLTSDTSRMTPFGLWLRSTSLDELPTLWNVLKGDMSLVGPRPLLVGYLDRYSPEQRRRHEVKPGVTGLAQVSGRNAIGWEERLNKDVEYVDTRSLILDLHIMLQTVLKVLKRDGISAEGDVTMPEFLGRPVGPPE